MLSGDYRLKDFLVQLFKALGTQVVFIHAEKAVFFLYTSDHLSERSVFWGRSHFSRPSRFLVVSETTAWSCWTLGQKKLEPLDA
jgi:hypothetical protein